MKKKKIQSQKRPKSLSKKNWRSLLRGLEDAKKGRIRELDIDFSKFDDDKK